MVSEEGCCFIVVLDPEVVFDLRFGLEVVFGLVFGLELTAPGKLHGGAGLQRGKVAVAAGAEAVALVADAAGVDGAVFRDHHLLFVVVGHGIVGRELGYGTVKMRLVKARCEEKHGYRHLALKLVASVF